MGAQHVADETFITNQHVDPQALLLYVMRKRVLCLTSGPFAQSKFLVSDTKKAIIVFIKGYFKSYCFDPEAKQKEQDTDEEFARFLEVLEALGINEPTQWLRFEEHCHMLR